MLDPVLVEALKHARRSHPRVRAVVLVGSYAESSSLAGSDIDLAVIVPTTPQRSAQRLELSGTKVDLQYFDADWLGGLCKTPILDLRGLREAGRLARGRVLFDRWAPLESVREAAAAASLSPLEAMLLLSRASAELHHAQRLLKQDPERCAWALQGAALSLAILAAALTPSRYQKPKWLLRDLERGGFAGLAALFVELVRGRTRTPGAARRQVARAEGALIDACALRGLPPLRRFEGSPDAYRHVRDASKDAALLLERSEGDAAVVVAAIALRYALSMLEDGDAGPSTTPAEIAAWLMTTVRRVVPASARSQTALGRCLVRLAEFGEGFQAHARELGERSFVGAARASRRLTIPHERSALLNLSRVHERLWMGAHQAEPEILQALGISVVILTAAERQRVEPTPGLEVLRIPLRDGPQRPGIEARLDRLVADIVTRIRDRGQTVYVGCNQGLNRSAFVAARVLMALHPRLSSAAIIRHLRRCRRGAMVTPELVDQLARRPC